MHFRQLFAAALLACAISTSKAAESSAGWRPLPLVTKGHVDTNWVHVGYGAFTVDGGALRTQPDPKGLGLLVYQKERFGDCQIRVVFKAKEKSSNSGLYVRIDDGILGQVNHPGASYDRDAQGQPSPESTEKMKASAGRDEGPWYAVHHGYEIQIASRDGQPGDSSFNGTGAVYSLANSTGVTTDNRNWVTMIVTLAGDRISVDVNGKRVSTFDSAKDQPPAQKIWFEPKREPKRPQKGYIGLQTHDPKDIVWFKEVSIRPLPKGAGK